MGAAAPFFSTAQISKFSSTPKNPTSIFIRFLRGRRANIGAVLFTMLLRFTSLVVVFFFFFLVLGSVNSHEESGEWSCESDPESQVRAEFNPGVVTVDGHGDDWKYVNGFDFSLLPALDPDEEDAYKGGKMTVKALHDGKDVFFLLQVDGEYVYSKG